MVPESAGLGIMGQEWAKHSVDQRLGAVRTIGLMSGTSLGGVDVALMEADGESVAGTHGQ